MGPIQLLEFAAKLLRKSKVDFALGGGVAANLYRTQPRLTQDVDLLLDSTEQAMRLMKQLKLHAGMAKASDLSRKPGMNKKNSPVVMVIGRKKGGSASGGLDVLLPTMPWVENAKERAQSHFVDFGFARLPTLTIEDLIIGKAFALEDNPSRYKDLDDLQNIFLANPKMDLIYLTGEFARHGLILPRELLKLAPKPLQRVARRKRG